jgi:hypothetical protein
MKIGKLYLVDLEGSERISKTKMEGVPLEEQKLINKSLIALSRIVQNLSNENDNITYAPYRDSKLTRIISDFFGGNAYTSLILNCSKHECSTIETRNTLMFGEKCKLIKNKPVINIEKNASQSIILGEIFGIENIKNDLDKNYEKNGDLERSLDYSENLEKIMNKYKDKNYIDDDKETYNQKNLNNIINDSMDKDLKINNRDKYMNKSIDKYFNRTMNKNMNESLDKQNRDKNMNKSMDRIMFKNHERDENRYLKMKVNHLREKMELDNSHIEKLNEKNLILENQNRSLKNQLSKFENNKNIEEEKEINNSYIKYNINNLHNLLNEQEKNEKILINEINSIKMIYERKIKELNDIINIKQKEISDIKENHTDNINTCQELTECLKEAGNQITIKEKIIEELIFKNENKTKENNDLINTINNLKQEKDLIKNNNDNKDNIVQQEKEEINNLNKKIIELNNELKNIFEEINNKFNEGEIKFFSFILSKYKPNGLDENFTFKNISSLKEAYNSNKNRFIKKLNKLYNPQRFRGNKKEERKTHLIMREISTKLNSINYI